jgi:hypothetical protein
MTPRKNKSHPALRSGLYSALTVLPGESRAAFRKLHRRLIEEFEPNGVSEADLVHDVARLTFRKENLATYRRAFLARRLRHQRNQQRAEELNAGGYGQWDDRTREEVDQEVREELGSEGSLLDLGMMVTDKALQDELDLIDRFDAIIARKITQLLRIKGMKQVAQLGTGAENLSRLEAARTLAPGGQRAIAPPKLRELVQG